MVQYKTEIEIEILIFKNCSGLTDKYHFRHTAHLHNGNNRSKLVHFKENKNIFAF